MADVITVMNLGWQYAPLVEGATPVTGLNNVTCYVPQGYFTGIVGPTGAGKTTLIRALVGVIPHMLKGTMSGFVRVAGMNVKSTTVADISSQVAYVSQNPKWQLFASTVEEEIAFPLENRRLPHDDMHRMVESIMSKLHIEHLRYRDPSTLSAGEAERVAIAVALVTEPNVLIIDEAMAALDAAGKQDLFQTIADIRAERSMSVVLVDQDTTGMAQWADAVFLLVNGEIIRRTTTDIFTREQSLLESVGVVTPQSQANVAPVAVDPSRSGTNAADQHIIELDHVTVDYSDALSDQQSALNDVSVDIERGAFVAVAGGNAAGKSTFVKLLNGLVRPTHGHVIVDGNKVWKRSIGQMAHTVGYVSQNPDDQLFCRTVREEISFGPQKLHLKDAEVKQRVNEMLALFDLYAIEDADPTTLSYGERRAVALAATLAMHPDVLVLDEPTAGLDRRLSTRLLNHIAALNANGTTVVMVTNDAAAIARYCTHLIHLENGTLVEHGRLIATSAMANQHEADKSRRSGHDKEGR